MAFLQRLSKHRDGPRHKSIVSHSFVRCSPIPSIWSRKASSKKWKRAKEPMQWLGNQCVDTNLWIGTSKYLDKRDGPVLHQEKRSSSRQVDDYIINNSHSGFSGNDPFMSSQNASIKEPFFLVQTSNVGVKQSNQSPLENLQPCVF